MERYKQISDIVLQALSAWQIIAFVLAGCAIGCLIGICRAIGKLSKSVLSIGTELNKINAKLEGIEVASRDNPPKTTSSYESNSSVEAAISDLEKLVKPRDNTV